MHTSACEPDRTAALANAGRAERALTSIFVVKGLPWRIMPDDEPAHCEASQKSALGPGHVAKETENAGLFKVRHGMASRLILKQSSWQAYMASWLTAVC